MKQRLVLMACLVFIASFWTAPIMAAEQSEQSYLADLPVVTHPDTFKWDFEGDGGQSTAAGDNTPAIADMQKYTHPDIFKWKFEGEQGGGNKGGEPWIKDMQVLTHPDIFKWRFGDMAKKEKIVTPAPATPEPPKKEEPKIAERDEPVEWIALPVRTVYFDYNKALLKKEAQNAIQQNSDFLKKNPTYKVMIEGHCDERGTQEYNLALGERRAKSIESFMVGLGIDNPRISTKSWGEELPAVQGHNEAAWSKNRRGEMYYSVPKK